MMQNTMTQNMEPFVRCKRKLKSYRAEDVIGEHTHHLPSGSRLTNDERQQWFDDKKVLITDCTFVSTRGQTIFYSNYDDTEDGDGRMSVVLDGYAIIAKELLVSGRKLTLRERLTGRIVGIDE